MADYIQIKNGSNIVYPVSWQEAFNFTINGVVIPNQNLPTGMTLTNGDISYALNESRTIGKIYGRPAYTLSNTLSASSATIPLNFSVKATGSQYSIILPRAFSYTWTAALGSINTASTPSLLIAANGSVSLFIGGLGNSSGTNTRLFVDAPACIYFFADFGDVLETDSE